MSLEHLSGHRGCKNTATYPEPILKYKVSQPENIFRKCHIGRRCANLNGSAIRTWGTRCRNHPVYIGLHDNKYVEFRQISDNPIRGKITPNCSLAFRFGWPNFMRKYFNRRKCFKCTHTHIRANKYGMTFYSYLSEKILKMSWNKAENILLYHIPSGQLWLAAALLPFAIWLSKSENSFHIWSHLLTASTLSCTNCHPRRFNVSALVRPKTEIKPENMHE